MATIYPSDNELKNDFGADPKAFKKHVNAIEKAMTELNKMGFHGFGGGEGGDFFTLVTSNLEFEIRVVDFNSACNGGAGDDLLIFESKD